MSHQCHKCGRADCNIFTGTKYHVNNCAHKCRVKTILETKHDINNTFSVRDASVQKTLIFAFNFNIETYYLYLKIDYKMFDIFYLFIFNTNIHTCNLENFIKKLNCYSKYLILKNE